MTKLIKLEVGYMIRTVIAGETIELKYINKKNAETYYNAIKTAQGGK